MTARDSLGNAITGACAEGVSYYDRAAQGLPARVIAAPAGLELNAA